MEFRRKPVAFNGEILFTAKLLALQNSQPLKAYFLQGHGESSLSDQSNYGYSKFGLALAQNYILPVNLELTGEHVVPEDCSLLIIAVTCIINNGSPVINKCRSACSLHAAFGRRRFNTA